MIGMHFFNPVPVMGLIEITPSAATGDDTVALVEAFGTEVLGKTCVRSSDEAGFIVNRLLIPYLFDAMRLYERGFATREDIDTAIQLGLAHPMGPLRLSDLIGLDTVLSIGEVLHRGVRRGALRRTGGAAVARRRGEARSQDRRRASTPTEVGRGRSAGPRGRARSPRSWRRPCTRGVPGSRPSPSPGRAGRSGGRARV